MPYDPPLAGARGVWERATAPTPEEITARIRDRRIAGVILGVLLGLAYGLVSQLINRVALPGIPLHQPPLGAFGNIVASAAVGGLLGALACVPNSAPLGIFYASLTAAIAIAVESILRLGGLVGMPAAVVVSVIFSVPFAWLTVPLVALLRWIAEQQAAGLHEGQPLLRRARLPVALILVMGFLASFEIMPPVGRDELRQTHAMLQAARQVATTSALPAPLRGPLMTQFPPAGGGAYTLEWSQFDLDRFIELRPPSAYDQHAAVIAHYSKRYALVCLYPTPQLAPICKNYTELPQLNAPARADP